MDIQTRKIEFVQKFLNIQNEEVISEFEKLLNEKASLNLKKDLRPFSVEELNKRAAQSEDDFKNGRYKTSEELREKF